MGDRGERLGPSPFSLSPQPRRSMLGHDPIGQRPRARHRRARLETWDDPRHGAVASRRGQRDDGGPPVRSGGAEDEVELAADPRHLPRPQALCGHLPAQIDLERRVDGHEAIVPRHDLRIVNEAGGLHVHEGVLVEEIEQPTRAHRLADVHAPAVNALERIGDRASLHERH